MGGDDEIPPSQKNIATPQKFQEKGGDGGEGSGEAASHPTTPKAKGKAKAKSKAKAKGKPKAKPTPKKSPDSSKKNKKDTSPKKETTMKRPAKAETLKRPATKGHTEVPEAKSNKRKVPEWAEEIEEHGSQEEPGAEAVLEEVPDTFEVDEARKDRSKDNKFKQLLLSGTLPDWVKKAWQATLKLTTGRQQKQRELVNKVLERTEDGRLQINADNPQLETLKETHAI